MNYIVQPRYIAARNKSKIYETSKKIKDKWEPQADANEGIGNVRPVWDRKAKKFIFTESRDDYAGMYEVISSALLLYRLLCLFQAPVKVEQDPYKCIWWITLKHKETGDLLMFGEWKGAAGIWTRFHHYSELPLSFSADTLEVLNLLASRTCPHPYDGCVAGSVA